MFLQIVYDDDGEIVALVVGDGRGKQTMLPIDPRDRAEGRGDDPADMKADADAAHGGMAGAGDVDGPADQDPQL
jgi:hypothetical protein